MFRRLFARNQAVVDAHAIYGALVARARNPRFYVDFGVPDTFDGRFEMLVLHLYTVHNRLKDEDAHGRAISQHVFDSFIDDMDSALREAAVGDQTVPKRIAKMTQVFYGRTGALQMALEEESKLPAVSQVIARNLFPDGDANGREVPLAKYLLSLWDRVDAMTAGQTIENRFSFEDELELETQGA